MITEIVKSTFTNRYLIGQLAKREIIGRYRGTKSWPCLVADKPAADARRLHICVRDCFSGAMGGNELEIRSSNLLWSFSLG